MLNNPLVHDTIKLFLLLMWVLPLSCELCHEVVKIHQVLWGCRCEQGHGNQLLMGPFSRLAHTQSQYEPNLGFHIGELLDCNVIDTLLNEVSGLCGRLSHEFAWQVRLGGLARWGHRLGQCNHGTCNQGSEIGMGLGINIEIPLYIGAQINQSGHSVGLGGIGCHDTRGCNTVAMCREAQVEGCSSSICEHHYCLPPPNKVDHITRNTPLPCKILGGKYIKNRKCYFSFFWAKIGNSGLPHCLVGWLCFAVGQ